MFRHRILPCSGILLLLFITACGGGGEDQTAVDPGTPLTLEENLVIRSGSDGGEAPFLSFVHEIAVDREGNVYVYDGSEDVNEIHKYDAQGNYQMTLGRQGGGPGEHRQVTAMFADSENRLITADRQNARITVFSPGGQVINNQPPPGLNTVVHIREMPDGRYILTGWHEERRRLMHLTSRDFTQIEASMGEMENVSPWFDNESQERFLSNQAGYAAPMGERSLLYAPALYGGRIHRFAGGGDGWSRDTTAAGYESIESPLVYGTQQNPPPRMDAMMFWQDRPAVMIMQQSISFGIYPLEDGSYLHLSFRYPGEEEQEEPRLVIERFSSSLELLQYTVTDALNLTGQRKRPLWVDAGGQLYLADNSDDSVSVVRRYQINGLGPEQI